MQATAELATTRAFAAGLFRFVVAASDPSDRALIETLFQDLPVPDPAHQVHGVFMMMRVEVEGGTRWAMNGPRLDDQPLLSLVSALTRLMAAVNLSALDADPESLHLHAAAATKHGNAVIIAAERNTGKTTTVAHLVARGWGFVTDETVRLPLAGDDVGGFPKPLSIKPGGDRLVEQLEAWMIPSEVNGDESYRFVPVGASGASISTGGRPRLVVLLRRPDGEQNASATSRRLHPADAVVALMQETLDADRFGSAASRLARLAVTARCCEVTRGSPMETAELIEQLYDEGPVEELGVTVLPPSPAVAEGVVSVAVGNRMVVHHQRTGQIFALDEAGSELWQQIGGWRHLDVDLAGPVVNTFVAQLRSLGVLATSTADSSGFGG